jgi:hypothetical protein
MELFKHNHKKNPSLIPKTTNLETKKSYHPDVG